MRTSPSTGIPRNLRPLEEDSRNQHKRRSGSNPRNTMARPIIYIWKLSSIHRSRACCYHPGDFLNSSKGINILRVFYSRLYHTNSSPLILNNPPFILRHRELVWTLGYHMRCRVFRVKVRLATVIPDGDVVRRFSNISYGGITNVEVSAQLLSKTDR